MKNVWNWTVLIVLTLALACSGEKPLAREIRLLAEKERFTGDLILAREGTVLFNESIGEKPGKVYRLGSRPFTALGIMILHEQGKLNIYDPVKRYVPGFPGGFDRQIHHLLSETSGLTGTISPEEVRERWAGGFKETYDALLEDFSPVLYAPDSLYGKNDFSYITLGYIIERVSGMMYSDFIAEKIFRPLEMTSSLVPSGTPAEKWNAPVSGIITTASDLLLWDRGLYTEKLVSFLSLERIFYPCHPGREYYYGNGYGWKIINNQEGFKMHSFESRIEGEAALIFRWTDRELFVAVLARNSSLFRAQKICQNLLSLVQEK